MNDDLKKVLELIKNDLESLTNEELVEYFSEFVTALDYSSDYDTAVLGNDLLKTELLKRLNR